MTSSDRIFTSQAIKRMAIDAGQTVDGAELDLAAHGVVDRSSYLAFVAAWKQEWHASVRAVRAAKAGMRRKGAEYDDARSLEQGRRESLRQWLNALHRLRVSAKAASVRQRRRAAAVLAAE